MYKVTENDWKILKMIHVTEEESELLKKWIKKHIFEIIEQT